MGDGGTALVYVWGGSEDYWQGTLPGGADDPADPFSHASRLVLFEAAARRLVSAGRAPSLRSYTANSGRTMYCSTTAASWC